MGVGERSDYEQIGCVFWSRPAARNDPKGQWKGRAVFDLMNNNSRDDHNDDEHEDDTRYITIGRGWDSHSGVREKSAARQQQDVASFEGHSGYVEAQIGHFARVVVGRYYARKTSRSLLNTASLNPGACLGTGITTKLETKKKPNT